MGAWLLRIPKEDRQVYSVGLCVCVCVPSLPFSLAPRRLMQFVWPCGPLKALFHAVPPTLASLSHSVCFCHPGRLQRLNNVFVPSGDGFTTAEGPASVSQPWAALRSTAVDSWLASSPHHCARAASILGPLREVWGTLAGQRGASQGAD